MKNKKWLLSGIVLVAVGAYGIVWLVVPYFVDRVVDDPLPLNMAQMDRPPDQNDPVDAPMLAPQAPQAKQDTTSSGGSAPVTVNKPAEVGEEQPPAQAPKPSSPTTSTKTTTEKSDPPAPAPAEPTAVIMPTTEPPVVEIPSEQKQLEQGKEKETQTIASARVTFRGVFRDSADIQTSGTVLVITDGEKQYLRLENFKTQRGPDLFVYVTQPNRPAGEGKSLGTLKGNMGNQNYEIPSDVDIAQYTEVVIWCRAFDHDFGYATLQPE